MDVKRRNKKTKQKKVPDIIQYNIIYFILTSQSYKWMKLFLSLLSERREMRASEKCHPGIGCWIEPRSSRTEGMCATDAPLHIQKKKQKKQKKQKNKKYQMKLDNYNSIIINYTNKH